jgi:integrase
MARHPLGTIRKSPDGKRWVVRLQFRDSKGRARGFHRHCHSYAEAREMLRLLQEKVQFADKSILTYRELDALYRREFVHPAKIIDGIKISGFRQPIAAVMLYLDRALEFFGDQLLTAITYADIEQYRRYVAAMATKHGRPRSASDINHHIARLRRVLNVAVERGLLKDTPFKRGSSLISRASETERTRILSRDEETRLLAACERPSRHRLRQMIIIAIETGLRRGEIESLRWNDIDLEKGLLNVQSTNSKTLRGRIVPLSRRAIDIFAKIKAERIARHDRLIFGRVDRKKSFAAACCEAGIKGLRFHDLRHTAITRWLEAGISPTLAMKASGHSQFRTFLRYVNPDADIIREFAARLDSAA